MHQRSGVWLLSEGAVTWRMDAPRFTHMREVLCSARTRSGSTNRITEQGTLLRACTFKNSWNVWVSPPHPTGINERPYTTQIKDKSEKKGGGGECCIESILVYNINHFGAIFKMSWDLPDPFPFFFIFWLFFFLSGGDDKIKKEKRKIVPLDF